MDETATRVVVVGGGHNGFVAAVLAARAGCSVTLLEASGHLGGATVSEQLFSGHPARLSRYSYLVSLMPRELIATLGIDFPLASRSVSSFTPTVRDGRPGGLLVERHPGAATQESFRELTGSGSEYRAWRHLYGELADVAEVLAPMLIGPLRTRSQARDAVVAAAGLRIWDDLMENPLGEMITRRFADDLVRGVVATDGLIGTHTSLFATDLRANRCFLYHVVGRGTGEWLVPIGGMGTLTEQLTRRAHDLGVVIETDAMVTGVAEEPGKAIARTADGTEYPADFVLAAVAPSRVAGWLGEASVPEVGAQLKVNMLLDRLPRLRSGVDPRVAFAGTTHLEEGFDQLEAAYRASADGEIPDPLPGEVYCHSLTDPTILGGRPGATLTLFGLHTPVSLFTAQPEIAKQRATRAALDCLQRHLDEPLEDCLARDENGELCIDVASPADLEETLNMVGGNIFHGDLGWPWWEGEAPADTPAQLYGVEVPGARRVLLAGAGTVRGGGVSGLGGLAAVQAMLERPA